MLEDLFSLFSSQKGHLQPLDDLVRGRPPTFQLQHGHHADWQQEVRAAMVLLLPAESTQAGETRTDKPGSASLLLT